MLGGVGCCDVQMMHAFSSDRPYTVCVCVHIGEDVSTHVRQAPKHPVNNRRQFLLSKSSRAKFFCILLFYYCFVFKTMTRLF